MLCSCLKLPVPDFVDEMQFLVECNAFFCLCVSIFNLVFLADHVDNNKKNINYDFCWKTGLWSCTNLTIKWYVELLCYC